MRADRESTKPGPARVIEAQLRLLDQKLDQLVAEAGQSAAGATVGLLASIHALRARSRVARAKLEGLRAEGNEERDTFQAGVESAWIELEAMLIKVMS